MVTVDYLILGAYFIISFGIALFYMKRSSSSSEEFFLSGRNLPWYLAGLSMVATTFAADTPLAVTEMVAKDGISGNWLWWNMAFGGVLTVFFFARLWRRAGIVTEAEFAEIRYSGKPAAFLRGFRGIYLGLFMNIIVMGWVNTAMIKLLTGLFGIPQEDVLFYVFACMAFVAVYSALSGLWGVVVTDAFQFIMAMAGCIVLAVIVVNSSEIGGVSGLQKSLGAGGWLQIFPNFSTGTGVTGTFTVTVSAFLAFIGIQWWASWYPGSEPGGGGYIAQRMMSAKNERHSVFATLFFQVAHYALRPWPWILVGLSTIILYPELAPADKGMGYVYAMRDFLPAGLKGLLVAAFFAAYMSTIATQLNWGASYLMNDVYRRFMAKEKSEKHYVLVSKLIILLMMVVSVFATFFMDRIADVWSFIIECGAGLGLVLILRWYWWRVNAWSEISAMITPFLVFPVVSSLGIPFPVSLYYIVPVTVAVFLVVTFLTKPADEAVLLRFYERVQPGGILWKPVYEKLPLSIEREGHFLAMTGSWAAGVVLVYSSLFGIGSLIFGDYTIALICGALVLAAALVISLLFNKLPGFSQKPKA